MRIPEGTSFGRCGEPRHSNNGLDIGNIFNANIQNINPTELLNLLISSILMAANGNNQNIDNMASMVNNTNTSEKVEPVPEGIHFDLRTGGEP